MITFINENNSNQYSVIFNEVQDCLNLAGNYLTANNELDLDDVTNLDERQKLTNLYNLFNPLTWGKWKILYSNITSSTYEYLNQYVTDDGLIQITSLQLYFGIIADLVDIDTRYGILPLDEPCFEIDANKRTITIPKTFTGVQVQGDHLAETIYFRIARYFDTVDLFGPNVEISIKYELPGSAEKRRIAPWTKIIDRNTGDIIFGWSLTDIATSQSGLLKFAVEFYISAEDDINKDYSFNTLTASIDIKKGIGSSKLDEIPEDPTTTQIILDRFTNGYIDGLLKANEPDIDFSNIRRTDYYFITSNPADYMLLTTATEDQGGALSYSWWHASEDPVTSNTGGTLITSAEATIESIFALCTIENLSNKTVVREVAIKDAENITILDLSDKINLCDSAEEFIDTYSCWALDGNIRLTSINDLGENVTFKLQMSKCLPKVSGYYWCVAKNTVGLQKATSKTEIAYFPKPVIPNDFSADIIRVGAQNNGGSTYTASLSIPTPSVTSSIPGLAEKTEYLYQWSTVTIEEDEKIFTDINGATSNSYTATLSSKEQNYSCLVTSKLNNTVTNSGKRKEWKVVNPAHSDYPTISISIGDEILTNNSEKIYSLLSELTLTPSNAEYFDSIKYSISCKPYGQDSKTTTVEVLISEPYKLVLDEVGEYTISAIGKVGVNNVEGKELIFKIKCVSSID